MQKARLLARDRGERVATGLAVVEGVRLVEEAISASVHLEFVLYSRQLPERERGAALLQLLRERRAPLSLCSPKALQRAADTETPQGIIAVFRPLHWRPEEMGDGLIILADNLQDPGNLGTIIRSLAGMGGAGLFVCGGVDPLNPKVIRGAMGSLFRLPVVVCELDAALAALRAQGRRIYIADAGGSLTPWTTDLQGRKVIVIGNEGAGPSAIAKKDADGVVSIPMPGGAESLNAGVAASLLVYEAMRQRLTGRSLP